MNKKVINSSQLAMHRAFIKEWKEYEYEKFSVKRICEVTPIARTTFYSYYPNLDVLKEEVEDYLIDGLKEAVVSAREDDPGQAMRNAIEYLTKKYDEFHTFLVIRLNYSFLKKWHEAIYNVFYKRYEYLKEIPNFELLIGTLSATALSIFLYYFKDPAKFDTDSLVRAINRTSENLVLLNQYDIDMPLLAAILDYTSKKN